MLQPVGDLSNGCLRPERRPGADGGEDSSASLWDARTGTKVLSVNSHGDGLAGFSPDGRSFATSQGRRVFIWNAEDGTLIHEWNVGTRIHAHIQPGRKSAADRLVGHNYMRQFPRPLGRIERNRDCQVGPATRATPNCKA